MFSCSVRCPEPLESAREAPEIEFGGLNKPSQLSRTDFPATPGKDSGFCSGRQNRSPGPPTSFSFLGRRPGGLGQGRTVPPPHGAAVISLTFGVGTLETESIGAQARATARGVVSECSLCGAFWVRIWYADCSGSCAARPGEMRDASVAFRAVLDIAVIGGGSGTAGTRRGASLCRA